MESKPLKIDNLEYIDSLRWIAILMVLMVHFSQLIPSNIRLPLILNNFFSYWQYGVILFFIVSAYTLFRSLNLRNEINFKNFFMRRFFRIAPLYYIMIILVIIYVKIFSPILDPLIYDISFNNFILHIIFINSLFNIDKLNVFIWWEWTIFTEVWFYLILPFIYLYKKHINIYFFISVIINILLTLYIINYNITWINQIIIYFSPFFHFSAFFIWCLIYKNENNEKINNFFIKYKNYILSFIISILLILSYNTSQRIEIYLIILTLLWLFFMLIKNNQIKIFDNYILRFIWKISFSLYLIHLFVLQFIWPKMIILKEFNIFITFTILISIIMILSYLSYYLIEINFINFWKKILKKMNMKNKILLSICIPTYNRADCLKTCLDSIVKQKWFNENIEIILSDNWSKDNTFEIISKFLEKYKNINYYKNETNLWFDKNLDIVVSKANWKYCMILWDDDWLIEWVLLTIINILNRNNIYYYLSNSWWYDINLKEKITLSPNLNYKNELNNYSTLKEFIKTIEKYPVNTVWYFWWMSWQIFLRKKWIEYIERIQFIWTQTIHLFVLLHIMKDEKFSIIWTPIIKARADNVRWELAGMNKAIQRELFTLNTFKWIAKEYNIKYSKLKIHLIFIINYIKNSIIWFIKKYILKDSKQIYKIKIFLNKIYKK
jgi:peptidoglycan/LPS O-acetylase OafA/YrhL/glycosyltransferase involved in cell wall biosynthesis